MIKYKLSNGWFTINRVSCTRHSWHKRKINCSCFAVFLWNVQKRATKMFRGKFKEIYYETLDIFTFLRPSLHTNLLHSSWFSSITRRRIDLPHSLIAVSPTDGSSNPLKCDSSVDAIARSGRSDDAIVFQQKRRHNEVVTATALASAESAAAVRCRNVAVDVDVMAPRRCAFVPPKTAVYYVPTGVGHFPLNRLRLARIVAKGWI